MAKLKIFLDANIFVSGIIFQGKEHELLVKNDKATFITSEDVIDETLRTIERKFPDSIKLAEVFLKIMKLRIIPREDYIEKLDEYDLVRDREDRHILAAAEISKSEFIVSGDSDLLSLKKYKNIIIVNTKSILPVIC